MKDRRAALTFAVLLVCVGAPSPSPAASPGDPSIAPDASPEAQNADLAALLEKLAARADQYRKRALGFTCEESLVKSSYDAERGTFKNRRRELYDYLFERSEVSGRLGEVRDIIEENGKPVRRSTRDLELEIPPSYAWSQIFAAENHGKFHFRIAGKILKGYRLLLQLEFTGWAALPGTSDIGGWSGLASVDSSTLNLVSISAEPSGQAGRVAAEKLKYQRSFQIMGVPLAGRPKSRTLEVAFGFESEDLSYPTETVIEKSVYTRSGEMGLEESLMLRYRSYRFFNVGTEAESARSHSARPAADPNAPATGTAPPPAGPAAVDPNHPRR
ncbi:MAG: hypothetical protein HY049_08625 [Acidobacteria bacterium]|nr:hypothetical protein [Acidobacteriota bacterium]